MSEKKLDIVIKNGVECVQVFSRKSHGKLLPDGKSYPLYIPLTDYNANYNKTKKK